MKTKLLFSEMLKKGFNILLILSISFSAFSQCPTIADSNPPPICDASGFTFTDLNTYATDNGGGIAWYNVATGGAPIDANQLVLEGTYYADDTSNSCITRESVTIDFEVDASNQNLNGIYCSNDAATIQTYIDDVLQPIIPSGSVEVYTDFNLTTLANGTDSIPLGFTSYFIVFIDSSNCRSQLEIGNIGVDVSPLDPTPALVQEFCSNTNPVIASLDPGTTGSYNWYANIDINGDVIQPALSPSEPLVNGQTYYIQNEGFFCDSNPIPVTVTIDDPFDSGNSGSLDYCDNSIPSTDFDLFDELGGLPDTNGTWSGSLSTSNGHLGTVNISTLTAGVYTFIYTVPSNGACPINTSNVVITIYETFTSGTVAAINPATFCEQDLLSAFDLFTLLDNEDPGGQWTQGTLSTDPVVTSPIDLTSLIPGTHNFTYTQNVLPNPCPEESTTVQVEVLQDPEAGNAINQVFCENDLVANSPFDLFNALDGTQDNNGGTWTDATNNTISNSIDITGFTVTGSPYLFTYTISNGTCEDSETISISIEPAPESGNALTPFEICEENLGANSPFDLFSLLDGTQDTNGTWYDGPDTSGTVVTSPIDISILTDGTYNYTYSVPDIGTCSDVDVTVQMVVFPTPETGTPSPAVFCENDLVANSPLDLFGQLTGEDSGGTWTDDNTTGVLSGSDVDLTSLVIGSYNFTYTITDANGCSNSSTVVVTIEDAPESGTANSPMEVCLSDIGIVYVVDLFSLLSDEDSSGVWNDDDATGGVSGSTVNISGLTTGTYNFTYDVDAIGTCDDVDVTVSIIINDTIAPTVTSPQEFCDTATVADLVTTGTTIQWYDNATGGTALAGTTALIDGEDYYATQTDATTGCESSVRTLVTATIYQSPNSGNPNSTPITECNDNNAIDLFTGLDGTEDAGGTWNNDDGVGILTGNVFDATGVLSGTYSFTYYVSASAPCIDSSTIITVTINEPLDAGTDGPLQDLCSNNGTVDLFTELGGTPDTGGTWSPALNSGTGVFDPLIDAQGTYTYSLTNACGTASSEVTVSVTLAPNAGTDNTAAICVIDGITDLSTFLSSDAQSGGTWSPALTSGTGEFDPSVDAAGVYTYTVTAISPCSPDATAQITVTVDDSNAPTVNDPNPEFCLTDNTTVADLDSALTITGTVIWYEDAALTTVANSTDSLVDGEDYYATQTNSSGCESSTNISVTVAINDSPTPILISSNQELCINDSPTINELTSNISYDATSYNVAWYDTDSGGSIVSESNSLSNGTSYYAVLVDLITGCESSIRLEVTPDLTSCGDLIIPDGFSPNGDGVNDTFDVDNLAILYPNFELEIYNRNGNIVYKGNANTPRFDGTSNQSRVIAKGDLPVGVYFYIFNYNDGENNPEQGRLYLSR